MRQGLLFQLEGSMSGVGDVGVVGDGEFCYCRDSVSALMAPDPCQMTGAMTTGGRCGVGHTNSWMAVHFVEANNKLLPCQRQHSPHLRLFTRSRDDDTTLELCSSSISAATTRTTIRSNLLSTSSVLSRLYIRSMLYACSGTELPTKTNEGYRK